MPRLSVACGFPLDRARFGDDLVEATDLGVAHVVEPGGDAGANRGDVGRRDVAAYTWRAIPLR